MSTSPRTTLRDTSHRPASLRPAAASVAHHPAADAFPMLDKPRFAELRDDIREHGQRVPIVLCEGYILDGRNRYRACLELGIEPRVKVYDGDPWASVWSLNGVRRDLVDEQRYLVWKFCHEHGEAWKAEQQRIADEANRKRSDAAKAQPRTETGFDKKQVVQQSVGLPDKNITQQSKAIASRTNPGAVARGDKLAKERPDLAAQVRLGEIRPAEAHRLMKRDEVTQNATALPEGQFTVLYVDPPWSYRDGRTGDRMTATGALDHYPTMPLSDLKALDVPSRAADNAVLFLWATNPLLEDALELCKAWGFRYKTNFVWDKVKHNFGHYNSVRHELLLICTKGSCTPERRTLIDSVQSIKRKKHSEKPEEFRTIIETLYPSARKVELFRRGAAPQGWTTWGNEVVTEDVPAIGSAPPAAVLQTSDELASKRGIS